MKRRQLTITMGDQAEREVKSYLRREGD